MVNNPNPPWQWYILKYLLRVKGMELVNIIQKIGIYLLIKSFPKNSNIRKMYQVSWKYILGVKMV